MAIIVPIIMGVTGASTAIAGALTVALGTTVSATMVTAVTSLAFQVTGMNNKINKAASKVFGEDLVMVANVVGAVYGAVNGGFELGSAAENASSAMSVNGSDLASDVFSAQNAADIAAGGAGLASDGLGGIYGGANALTDPSSALSVNGMDSASDTFNLANKAAGGGLASDGVGISTTAPDASSGVNLLDGGQELGVDTKALVDATKTAAEAPSTGAATQSAAANDAAAVKASSEQQLKVGDVTKGVQTPKVPTLKPPATTKPGSFFDKLLSNDKAMGAVVQGVGGAISSAAQSKSQKEALEFQKRLKTSVPTLYTKVQS